MSYLETLTLRINELCNKMEVGFLSAESVKHLKEEIKELVEKRERIREAFKDERRFSDRHNKAKSDY